MRLKFAVAAIAISIAVPSFAARPETVDTEREGEVELRYQFARGNSTSYVLEANFQSEGLEGTYGERVGVQLTMPLTFEVQSVDANDVALIATSLRSPAFTVTEQGEPASSSSMVASLRDARLSQSVSSDGTVSERSGVFTINNNRDAFALGFIADVLAIRWAQFPREAVSIGESWLQVIPMDINEPNGAIAATISVRYTMVGYVPGANIAVIDTEYSTAVDGTVESPEGRSSRLTGRGDGTGYILFDIGAHRITEMSFSSGLVLATVQNNGARSMLGFREEATLRSRVIEAVVTP